MSLDELADISELLKGRPDAVSVREATEKKEGSLSGSVFSQDVRCY